MPLFRRIATILLLTFLLFNWVGYWLLISWYESRESAGIQMRIDHQQYDRGQLVLLKVSAASIPYSSGSTTFERVEGDLELGNIHYRYVLKRLYNDSIEFLCLPDSQTGRIRDAKSEIIHLAIDGNSHSRPSPSGKSAPPLLTIFYQQMPAWDICNFPAPQKSKSVHRVPPLCAGHAGMGWRPPRMS